MFQDAEDGLREVRVRCAGQLPRARADAGFGQVRDAPRVDGGNGGGGDGGENVQEGASPWVVFAIAALTSPGA